MQSEQIMHTKITVQHAFLLIAGGIVGILIMPFLSAIGWIVYLNKKSLSNLLLAIIPTVWAVFSVLELLTMPYWYG